MPDKVVNYDHDDQRPRRTWFMLSDPAAGPCAFEPEFHCTTPATYPEGTPRWCETCWIFRKPTIVTFLEDEKRVRLKRLAESGGPHPVKTPPARPRKRLPKGKGKDAGPHGAAQDKALTD